MIGDKEGCVVGRLSSIVFLVGVIVGKSSGIFIGDASSRGFEGMDI